MPWRACEEHHPREPESTAARRRLPLPESPSGQPLPPRSLRAWDGLGRRAQLFPDTHTTATRGQRRGRVWHPRLPLPPAGSFARLHLRRCPPPSRAWDAPPSRSQRELRVSAAVRSGWVGSQAGAWSPGSPRSPASPGRGRRPPRSRVGRKPRLSTTTSRPRRNPNR